MLKRGKFKAERLILFICKIILFSHFLLTSMAGRLNPIIHNNIPRPKGHPLKGGLIIQLF